MPYSLFAVVTLLLIFIVFYRIERIRHERALRSIPIRIWVNGTRGKSSVTRLIAAGLRAAGKKVIAKTTGTSACIITHDGAEQPVVRLGMANIREQLRILKSMADEQPDAVVLECMALKPDLQKTEATHIVQPDIAVITNARPDHLDVMGPTVTHVAEAFVNALPRNCALYCAQSSLLEHFSPQLQQKNVTVTISVADAVSNQELKKFTYVEHRANVALALAVCAHLNIDKKTALNGMYAMQPDPGVLRKETLSAHGKCATFVNAMAANDTESTWQIWKTIEKKYNEINVLINCRDDRMDRSFRIAELIKERIPADHYILTGTGTHALVRALRKSVDVKKIHDLGSRSPDAVVARIMEIIGDKSLIFAIGNTVGYGMELSQELHKLRKTECS
jgi:poly-gamma-glutamate synthase PgsB/CapB